MLLACFVAIAMPSPQYYLVVDNVTVAVLHTDTSTITAAALGDTEIRLKDNSKLGVQISIT